MTGFGGTDCAGEVSPLRILIADDSDAIRGVLGRLIGEDINGCEICGGGAVDGREVLRKAAELRPDAILLDLSIPVLSGLDAAKMKIIFRFPVFFPGSVGANRRIDLSLYQDSFAHSDAIDLARDGAL